MVVGRFVARHRVPIHCGGGGVRLREARHHVGVPALSVSVIFVDECNSAETALKSRQEIGVGEISLEAHPLMAFAVEQYDGRSPHGIEAVEPRRVFLDVGLHREEVLVDELCGFLVLVRLGIQPSTGASRRRRAEVEQNGPPLFLRR